MAAINHFFINKSSSLDKGAPNYFLRERTIILVSETEMVSNCLKPQRVFCGGVDRTSGATTRKWSDPCGVVWVSMGLLIVLWVPYVRSAIQQFYLSEFCLLFWKFSLIT